MESYEQLGCTTQALLEAGYRLSIEVAMQDGTSVGRISIINEGTRGFHVKFDGENAHHTQNVVDILKRYIGEKAGVESEVNKASDPYAFLRAMFPGGYFGY